MPKYLQFGHHQLKAAEKVLGGLEKEQVILVRKKDGYERDIEKAKQDIVRLNGEIKKNEGNIETNKKDQEKKKDEVGKQQKVVKEIEAKEKAVN